MASSDALWNEVARIVNKEFQENGQPLTGPFLMQIIIIIRELLTDDNASG